LAFPDIALDMTHTINHQLFALVAQAKSIALTTHVASDGDGMVAAIALQEILRLKGQESTIITDGEDLSRYGFLMENTVHQVYQEGMAFELVLVLDCNSYDRLGERAALIKAAKRVFVLDHHVIEHQPIPADLELIDSHYVSVGAMIYRLFEQEIMSLEPERRKYIADCVYVTILNDTNNFANANTTAEVFALCADLARQGLQAHLINMAYLQNQSAKEMLYLGHSLASIKLYHHDQILFLHSALALAQKLELDPSSLMSISRYVQGVQNLLAIAYFREVKPDVWKISLRSLQLNVQEFAARHGGGGHRKAAGLTLKGSLQQVQELILTELTQAVEQL